MPAKRALVFSIGGSTERTSQLVALYEAEALTDARTPKALVDVVDELANDPGAAFVPDVVYVEDVAALGIRSPEMLARIVQGVRRCGVHLVCASDPRLDTRRTDLTLEDVLTLASDLRRHGTSVGNVESYERRNMRALRPCANCHDRVVRKARPGHEQRPGHVRDPRTGAPGPCTAEACGCATYREEGQLLQQRNSPKGGG